MPKRIQEDQDKIINDLTSMLCPPGEGVFTIHTASQFRLELQNQLYACSKVDVREKWLASIKNSLLGPGPMFLGISSDTGGGIQRGANWGPLFVRHKFLDIFPSEYPSDLGDIRVIAPYLSDELLSPLALAKSRHWLYQDEKSPLPVAPLSVAKHVADLCYKHFPKKFIFGLGGDHSVSYPLVKSFLEHHKKERTAVLHFDAHTDLLEERQGVPVCFGSWAFHILSDLHEPGDLIQIGIRSSGRDRNHWQNTYGVQQWWANDLRANEGIKKCTKEILDYLKKNNIKKVYVSFDIDALDSMYASATGTPEKDGLGPHDVSTMINEFQEHLILGGADLVEVAPFVNSIDAKASGGEITLTNAALIVRKLLHWAQK